MSDTTRLQPLESGRARQLAEWLRHSSADDAAGLALDDSGFVTGVVPVDDTDAAHVLGDLDVHA